MGPSRFLVCLALIASTAGCSMLGQGEPPVPGGQRQQKDDADIGKITGEEGIVLFGGKKSTSDGATSGIAVNSYLWRASLDALAFMPLSSADPFGGVIITDWYSAPESPNERFKMNVLVMDRQLRADGIRVTVFKQVKDFGGNWADATVDPKTGQDLENAILTRARQMRLDTASRN